jgi:cytochrome c
MKLTWALVLISATIYGSIHWHGFLEKDNAFEEVDNNIWVTARHRVQENSPPQVKILMPGADKVYTWGTQIRYTISVSDAKDGESQYGEINANEVLLEITYLPVAKGVVLTEQIKKVQARQEPRGLALIKKSTCFGCHADKTRVAGPSFLEIAGKYEPSPEMIRNLGSHIVKGSSGNWGNMEMPAHPDFAEEEAKHIADYILKQGANKYHWIYPGLEGAFRVIEKPENDSEGIYILTASYTNQTNVLGKHSVVLKIR